MNSDRPYLQQGRRIRQAREARSWTQTYLGEQIMAAGYRPRREGDRVTKNAISRMERGLDDVPRRMRAAITRTLPGLELDPLADDDLDPALLRIAS